eukprot:TRINITY_DN10578_c0_g3_i2.p1 TRINITY_DN10578_c0_g3~~TRINITY_DN10578_c0_g3_i2.p1  ORF type:complete len:1113 (+),score=259.16 TRINITY_DN10578_c0_g3_i2:482-3820(+)
MTTPNSDISDKYLSTIVNSYEKCLIALSWNRIYNGNDLKEVQVVRTTYTIKTHVDFIHNTATEFYSTGTFAHKEKITTVSAQNAFWSPCRMNNRYYWHPYKQLYFYFDEDVSSQQHIVITCFPYKTPPSTACGADFDDSGTPVFTRIPLADLSITDGTLFRMQEFVTFGVTANALTKSAYVAVTVSTAAGYESRIYRMDFTGTSCQATGLRLEPSPIFISAPTMAPVPITYLAAIHNVGIGFVVEGVKGIHIVPININNIVSPAITINDDAYWKLLQMGIDTGDPPPVFALSSEDPKSFYRVTNIATRAYKNGTINFYDYPVDVGRFHVMVVHPGGCGEFVDVDSRNHDVISVLYVSLETMTVDMCVEETLEEKCGNGVLDAGEECDDGNNRVAGLVNPENREGDGCNSDCKIELGWRCYNSPYVTRTQCEHNECGDSFINKEPPEFEECDDGNLKDGDGCTSTCKKVKGWFCPLPGYACIKVCSNSELDYYPGPPHNVEVYKEACDDGNEFDNDGCSSDCQTIEPEYECIQPGKLCRYICGNGYENNTVEYGREQCDDGNRDDGDGCESCKITEGYKCPEWGKLCRLACGDGIVDKGIPEHPDYMEDCDVGDGYFDPSTNTYPNKHPDYVGFGCSNKCKYVNPNRVYSYLDEKFEYYRENYLISEIKSITEHCPSIYLPPEIGPNYNYFAGEHKCYGGIFCLDCAGPKFPGYPLSDLYNFTDFTPHMALPALGRGRLRALNYDNKTFGFSYVHDLSEVIVQGELKHEVRIDHGMHPAMRETFGRHFVGGNDATPLMFYAIDNEGTEAIPDYKIRQKAFGASDMRTLPPQLGAEFFIWWPGPDYLLSRLYNGRNFEIIPFNNETYNIFSGATGLSEELLLKHSHIPNFEVIGDIVYYPAFLKNVMYIPLALRNFDALKTTSYQVNLYTTEKTPWEITLKKTVLIPERITSIASFEAGVVVSMDKNPYFYGVDNSVLTIDYTGGPVLDCDLEWKFIQSRPSPERPGNSPPVYAFCKRYEIYNVTYEGTTLTIDNGKKIELSPDTELPEKGKARFNLEYPYDLNGPFLINFGVYKNSRETGYKYEIWNTLAVSYINLDTSESSHIVIKITSKLM